MRIVSVVSGGIDSVTMAHWYATRGHEQYILTFDYGQRQGPEIAFAKDCAARLAVPWTLFDLSQLGPLLCHNCLTGSVAIPHGEDAFAQAELAIVPNRNAVFLSLAFALAADRDADAVAVAFQGAMLGDVANVLPDARPEFVTAFAQMERLALADKARPPVLLTPFLDWSKGEVIRLAASLDVPLHATWTCYDGGPAQCGACRGCLKRRTGFVEAGVPDPTVYEGRPGDV